MRGLIAFGLAFALTLTLSAAPASARADNPPGDADKLIGTYKIVSGKAGEKDVAKEHLDGSVTITRDLMTTYDPEHKEVYVIRYELNGARDRAQKVAMTVTKSSRPDAKGMKAKGLIKAEGNKVMLIYDFKGQDYPTGFEPKNDGQNMFVLERLIGK